MSPFALVDVNNFYVSCQRVFEPKLEGKPVLVLSNNDGCAIARSAEVKALGVKMGAPWHQMQDLVRQHSIIARSSNCALYADMSTRVMTILRQFSPHQEVYSIDECFLGLRGIQRDLIDYGQEIRGTVKQWTGLPVCVGIGPTKTLAKLANHLAKKRPEFNSVCDWQRIDRQRQQALMAELALNDVWGVGPRIAARLQTDGIHNVATLAACDPETIRQRYSVVLQRTVLELRGVLAIELAQESEDKQQICCARSFGHPVYSLEAMGEAVSVYAARAAEKLRRQHSIASGISVFIQTNPFKPNEPQYNQHVAIALDPESDDTLQITRYALWILKRIYRPGFAYAKAGVMLTGLQPRGTVQRHLFRTDPDPLTRAALNETMDRINARWGRGTMRTASAGTTQDWKMRQNHLSPAWTTRWPDIPVAR